MTPGKTGDLGRAPSVHFFAWCGQHRAGTRVQYKGIKDNGVESGRTSSASLSSDDKDDTPELAAAAPTLSKLPLYKCQLAHPESILIRPLYNLSLKRRGGQHPHRTKMEVFNLKKYRCIKKWGVGWGVGW